MTKIGIIAFSKKGGLLGRRLVQELNENGFQAEGFLAERHHADGMRPFAALDEVTRSLFDTKDIMIYVGACGIAVRAIAPYIRSKLKDPGVLVADECGKYVISLLSGHVGRANHFAKLTARLLGAEPVITTATDRNGLFAVDDWAVSNHLRILHPKTVREISSRILEGEKIRFVSDFPAAGDLPPQLTQETGPQAGIVISYDTERTWKDMPVVCRLVPMDLAVGIGCRKGKPCAELQAFLQAVFAENKLQTERIGKLCSVAVKAEEEGLRELADTLQVPFETYTVQQLAQAEGCFAASAFVEKQLGIDNVCERSACLGSGSGTKLIGKQSFDGMTLAVYKRELTLCFSNL